jgi:nucleotide-binding universal stress UspA family protein
MMLETGLSHLFRPQVPLKTVLVGTMLENESDHVVRAGLAVARAAGARLHLIHAIPEGPRLAGAETGGLEGKVADGLRAWCEERLREQIDRLGIGEAELAGAEVKTGEPHRVLIDTARQSGAELIVVGATASGPFAAELLGSTADRALRKATCPVLVVRGELRVPPRRALAPVDLSPLSADAFRCGLDLLAQLAQGAEVEVRAVYASSLKEIAAPQRRKRGETSAAEAERHSGDELRRFVLENQPDAPLKVEAIALPGEARFEILRELSERPADLVMLGTHGRGGMDRLMMGSVASMVARKAPCSVLMISPEAALAEGIAEAITSLTTPAWHGAPAPVA